MFLQPGDWKPSAAGEQLAAAGGAGDSCRGCCGQHGHGAGARYSQG